MNGGLYSEDLKALSEMNAMVYKKGRPQVRMGDALIFKC